MINQLNMTYQDDSESERNDTVFEQTKKKTNEVEKLCSPFLVATVMDPIMMQVRRTVKMRKMERIIKGLCGR